MEKNPKKNIQGYTRYVSNPGFYGRTPSYPQKDPIKLDNLQVSTAKKEKKGRDGKPVLNYYTYGKPGHITRNYRSKNKVQQP